MRFRTCSTDDSDADSDSRFAARGSLIGHLRAFVVTLLALDALMVVVGTYLLPPDPFAQLILVRPLLLLAPMVARRLVYHDGFGRVRAPVKSDSGGR